MIFNKQYIIGTKMLMVLFMAVMFTSTAFAQKKKAPTTKPAVKPIEKAADTAKKDTTKKDIKPAIKSYASVITNKFKTNTGLFTVHRDKDVIYFEIPDSILKRDIMVINRLKKAPGGYGMYAGEQVDEKTIHFELGPDSTIKIRYVVLMNEANPEDAIFKAVESSNLNPIAASFPIKAYGKDRKSFVIDVSKFLKDKNFVNSVDPGTTLGKNVNLAGMKDFYIESIHVYPINVEFAISKTMDSKAQGVPAGTPVTIETNTSFIALPKVPMQRRFYDPRVGYFTEQQNSFKDKQQRAEVNKYIVRWRLEPKKEDVEKWKQGALVEAANPIVIYIDPGTPKQWRPFLIAGINDWQKAFEQAGFKNAIIGKEWPENDTTMHMDDARYSMLNYFPSEIANAYGPQIHDPRSGEIIQTHIGWYHNVMEILHDWYMIQAGATDPKARKAKFDEDLMGELIRFVSSHEVGHTLGLRHNFGSSSRTPVDSLRSKSYIQKHGHTASIMDYARFNYVAQPEDNMTQEELFPRIGEYDKWAIEWGYKNSNAANAEEDKKIVQGWILKRIAENPRLWFGDGEEQKIDPRCQTEDLGDDAMKASTYGIKNLQRILPNLPEWSKEENGYNVNLKSSYKALKDQYVRYLNHVLKNVGGITYTIKAETEAGNVYEPVATERQKSAIAFLNAQLFTTPTWLMNDEVLNKVNEPTNPSFVEDIQGRMINSLLDIKTINKLLGNTRQFGVKAYPVNEYISDLHSVIWKDIKSGSVKMDNFQRNMQKTYLGAILDILNSKEEATTDNDAFSIVNADLFKLQKEVKSAVSRAGNDMDKYHLLDLQRRIDKALENKS